MRCKWPELFPIDTSQAINQNTLLILIIRSQENPQFHNFERGLREPHGGEAGTADEDAGVDAHPNQWRTSGSHHKWHLRSTLHTWSTTATTTHGARGTKIPTNLHNDKSGNVEENKSFERLIV